MVINLSLVPIASVEIQATMLPIDLGLLRQLTVYVQPSQSGLNRLRDAGKGMSDLFPNGR
jgi:hypothetical protein